MLMLSSILFICAIVVFGISQQRSKQQLIPHHFFNIREKEYKNRIHFSFPNLTENDYGQLGLAI